MFHYLFKSNVIILSSFPTENVPKLPSKFNIRSKEGFFDKTWSFNNFDANDPKILVTF